MLTTYTKGSPRVEIIDSTVMISEGGVHIGNTFAKYPGGQITFPSMISYGSDSSKYQNSLLYLDLIGQAIDMTTSVSTPVATQRELTLPTLPTDATNPYALGLFTFYSSDGTVANLIENVTI